jgi:hypothetical protein
MRSANQKGAVAADRTAFRQVPMRTMIMFCGCVLAEFAPRLLFYMANFSPTHSTVFARILQPETLGVPYEAVNEFFWQGILKGFYGRIVFMSIKTGTSFMAHQLSLRAAIKGKEAVAHLIAHR